MGDTQDKAAPAPNRSRWWLRISLRTLLVAMTLLALGLGYLTHRARQQEWAAKVVERIGGKVTFDYQIDPETGFLPEARPPGPDWLVSRIGPHFTATVIGVDFLHDRGGFAAEGDLAALRALPHLRSLSMGSNPTLSDDGLKYVTGLKQLAYLDLSDTGITDEGLQHLSGLEKLSFLSLVRCRMDGSGLRHLRQLPLHVLNLNWTRLADANVEHVGAMQRLEVLDMQDTPITDEALLHIRELTNLWELHIHNTSVSDAGLAYLQGMTKLKNFQANNTKVTKEGLAELKTKLPLLPKP